MDEIFKSTEEIIKQNAIKNEEIYNVKMRGSFKEKHVTGYENIFKKEEISKISGDLIERGFKYSNVECDFISLKIEKIKTKPIILNSLNVSTFENSDPELARNFILENLKKISKDYINILDNFYNSKKMSGALVYINGSGIVSDKIKGLRVSCLGSTYKAALKDHFNEALTLATKVSSTPGYLAEICVSDDLNYTTGYFASHKTGYLRIKNIKNNNDFFGGRIFIFRENSNYLEIKNYLENVPVIVKINENL